MNTCYFAFKINPIDAMRLNIPRPHSQDYGVLCGSYQDAQKWLKEAALVPENPQDWLYQHYQLPAVDMIVTAEPTATITRIQEPLKGTAEGVFSSRMQQFKITSMEFTIGQDEVHPKHMVGCSMSAEYHIDNLLLQSVASEMSTRMADIAEYQKACERYPEIPKHAMQTWAATMFNSGIHEHRAMHEYFDEFVQCYAREVAYGEKYGPQYGVEVITMLATEEAARQLYAKTYNKNSDAFDIILESTGTETLPYRQEQFMLILQPERYKELLIEHIPQDEKEQFSNMWDSKMNDARITNQVALRTGEIRMQDISLQVALAVCAEMEFATFRAQSEAQCVYSQLRNAIAQDEVKLDLFDNLSINEHEEALEN